MKNIVWLLVCAPLTLLAQTGKISLEDVFKKGTFRAESVPGFHTMRDGRYYTQSDKDGLQVMNFVTGQQERTLVSSSEVRGSDNKALPLDDIEWSSNEQKILVFTDRERIYRRSSNALVYAYDLATKTTTLVDSEKIMHATFSPDGNKVAFVKNNNLYYKDLPTNTTIQVTFDGEWNKIINGSTDWVYEEEFGFTRAFQWSPNSDRLAYYRFNEQQVPQFTLFYYTDLYPPAYNYKYPKAGEPNSVIEIHVYHTANRQNVLVDIGQDTDIYIPRIKWTTNNNTLAVAWMNRLQNNLKWLAADATTGRTTTLYNETNPYYISVTDDLQFLNDGAHFILTSEQDGFKHIYLYNIDGTLDAQLTKGSFDVDAIAGLDEKNKKLYYTAAFHSPIDRQLFVVNYGSRRKVVKQVTAGAGTHAISMNSDCSYYLDRYSTINTPPIISIFSNVGRQVRQLKDNAGLKGKMADYGWSNAQFIKVPTSKGDSLNGWMLKPADFNEGKQYPVLFCNYGGPGSQQVADAWGKVSFWHQLLAQQGYIVVSFDNTGTGYRGQEFKKKTYLRLGQLEIEDQVDAAKYLGTLPYINRQRIGHWGWSFGGFMSCLAITKGADVFKTAVAVAPVTDWQFYDNIYTERFMRTPQQNPKGYFETAPLNFTNLIKGNLFIIHGTADDNVHFQNSVMMVDKMIENNIPFSSAYYPNKNHGISGGNTSLHIYTAITNYIKEKL